MTSEPVASPSAVRSGTPRAVLTWTALGLGGLGLVLLFAPSEASEAFGWGRERVAPAMAGAGFLSVAILDWMGRGAIYGGIHGRPLILANLTLAFVGGITALGSQLSRVDPRALGWVPVVVLVVQGIAFLSLLRAETQGRAARRGRG